MSERALLCHMKILLSDGSTADDTKVSGKPARLNIGDGSLSPAFEAEIESLLVGDLHRFTLEAIDAFGETNPDAVHHLDKTRFAADMELTTGMIISFTDPSGADVPGIIREVAGDSVTVDLNHPLAGHQLTFELEVMQVL